MDNKKIMYKASTVQRRNTPILALKLSSSTPLPDLSKDISSFVLCYPNQLQVIKKSHLVIGPVPPYISTSHLPLRDSIIFRYNN